MIISVTVILKHFTSIIDIPTKVGTSHHTLNTNFLEVKDFSTLQILTIRQRYL